MNDFRSKTVTIFLLLLFVIILGLLADRMLIRKKAFFHAGYKDKAFTQLMEDLIAENVFIKTDAGFVVDEQKLKARELGLKVEKRVRENTEFLYTQKNRTLFDANATAVGNSRVLAEDRVIRGSILDRNGMVLVVSSGDERTGRQSRQYAFGPELYPITGHWSPIYGKRGIESVLDDYLGGRNHAPVMKETNDPLNKIQLGDNVTLTVDQRVQQTAYRLMGERKGAVVVLDIRSGEIVTSVSTPSFDPNSKERKTWREAFGEEKESQVVNRALTALYPPGSTFKAVVASAYLEQQGTKDHSVVCNGKKNRYAISDIHTHGTVGLRKAFADSCNIYFSEIGVDLGRELLTYAERFGFNKPINILPQFDGLSLNSEMSRAFKWQTPNEKSDQQSSFSERDFRQNPKLIAQGAIGQNMISATPLQMAVITASIANKGVLVNPYLVKEIRTGDNKKVLFSAKPVRGERVLREDTAAVLSTMMEDVMTSGTGRDVKKIYRENGKYYLNNNPHFGGSVSRKLSGLVKGGKGGFSEGAMVKVAGKTGTAEVGDKNGNGKIDADEKPHSWFIGFAPADNPRYAVAVVAENQGFGSLTAAPIAVEVLVAALNGE